MPVEWLEGFEQIHISNRWVPRRAQLGRSHLRTPTKLVIHTTEGSTIGSAVGAYRRRAGRLSGGVHPHATVDPSTRERAQHVPLTKASYSLKGHDRDGSIQIEIVGSASESHDWPPSWYEWLRDFVVGPILAAVPTIPASAPWAFLGEWDGLLAAPYPVGKARVSSPAWLAGRGIVGHQHAPLDDHWDPGAIRVIDLIPSGVMNTGEEEIMHLEKYRDPETGEEFVTYEVNHPTARLAVRKFSDPRGDGEPIKGLKHVVENGISLGLLVDGGGN